ncbi:hypothetical protein CP971_03660 [Streptomyces viridifaciens]|nr:hypothetical protein CP971_03660 [Streptomyces viridifaciens]
MAEAHGVRLLLGDLVEVGEGDARVGGVHLGHHLVAQRRAGPHRRVAGRGGARPADRGRPGARTASRRGRGGRGRGRRGRPVGHGHRAQAQDAQEQGGENREESRLHDGIPRRIEVNGSLPS